jgi:acyl carrier protein
MMEDREILSKIKKIIAEVADLDPADISDDASFSDDLELDSLSRLEVGVDINYDFKLDVQDERMQKLKTVQDALQLVKECLAESASDGTESTEVA